jgi:omega-6 fatty acid desaturase (delta-12 desaturase)
MPKHLFEKSTLRGILFVIRDVAYALLLFELAGRIDSVVQDALTWGLRAPTAYALQLVLWLAYWFFQSVVFAGCWVLAHEAGHGTIASAAWINDLVGFTLHTVQFLPHKSVSTKY